jgi:predicted ATPase/DNA-binding SARP family transcriptional activator
VIELRTLGGLRLEDGRGRDLCGQLQPKRLALLIYLAQAPRRFHRRDSLLALFWPELDTSGGRNALRQSLYALRHCLGNGALVARGYEEVAISEKVWSDVVGFESALASGHPERALELYQGDFLEGLHVQNVASQFEHWLDEERHRLRNEAVRAALELRDREEAAGNVPAAVDWARAACRLDPDNEGILGGLIDLLDRAGDRAGALRAFEAFAERTRAEYDIGPSEETQALIEAVKARGEPVETAAGAESGILEPLTPFIGRGRTVDELEALLADSTTRLVTLTGLGGVGKTRVALQVARRLEGRFADGVARIGFGEGAAPREVLPAIARAVGIPDDGRRSPGEALADHLDGKEWLVVLDGFERVVSAGPDVVRLCQAASGLKVLVTSRVPLRVAGEREFPIAPLSLPQRRIGLSVEFPLNSEAIALFADRARAVRPDFRLTARNLDAVADICRRLDGLPLAIELAAARVKVLTPQAIARHLEDRFALLSRGPVDLPPGQRTLVAAVEWSYELLDDRERELFRRLAVFSGGFGLELVEPLFEAWSVSDVELLDGLASLVDLSLVSQLETAGEPRFGMLDTVHAYAQKLLAASGEEEDARRRHASMVREWVEDGEKHYCADGQDDWLRRVDRDHANVRAAVRWALDRAEGGIALRLMAALWPFWFSQGYLAEAVRWLGQALAIETVDTGLRVARAKALLGACWMALAHGGDEDAVAFVEESLALFRSERDEPGYTRALETLGFAHLEAGRLEPARATFEECLARSRESNDDRRLAIALNALGEVALDQGDDVRAEELLDESVSLARRMGLTASLAQGLLRLGDVARRRGAGRQAVDFYQSALDTYCQLGLKVNVAWVTASLGNALMDSGRIAEARQKFTDSLDMFRDLGYAAGTARALIGIAGIAIAGGDAERGARLLGGIQELVGRAGKLPPDAAQALESLRGAARERLREAKFTALCSEGSALDPEAVVALAASEGSGPRHRAIG